jgi:assimilatory nitrate reductase electron transfer subunit
MTPAHVVVIGHGMVGARFAEEVTRHDPGARRVRLTVVSAEPRPAYNRVLLPNLLSGVMVEEDLIQNGAPRLPAHADLRTGVTATGLDLAGQTVRTSTGGHLRYDALVLATGARAHLPPLPGIGPSGGRDHTVPRDYTGLRSIADARRICGLA